jgi:signal transduction histidine kinase
VQLFDRREGGDLKSPSVDRRRGGDTEMAAVVNGARSRAKVLTSALRGGAEAERLAATLIVARGLSGLWVQRRWRAEDVRGLLEEAADIVGVSVDSFTLGVSLYTLCDPALLELPTGLAIEAQIELLRALADLDDVSLWVKDPSGSTKCAAYAGGAAPSRRARAVATETLDGLGRKASGPRLVFGVAVMRWQRPHAALVGRVSRSGRDRGLAFLDQAAAMIGPMLERHTLLERNTARENSLVQAGERRLRRVGLDLHDQPLQEVSALASELRTFRDQLGSVDWGPERRGMIVGRVQDLEARLASLDTGLRALCHSLEPAALTVRPLPELLQREADDHATRADIDVELLTEGDFEDLTASQQIALVRVVQECLSNAREHSGASEVRVEVRSTSSHIEARVIDNGCGFDVEATLLDAARRGRLGLVGVHERVRLLGGTCDVTSQPGGPTTVSVVLSRWQPESLAATGEGSLR